MNEFYLERYFKLWEEGNTLQKRVVLMEDGKIARDDATGRYAL